MSQQLRLARVGLQHSIREWAMRQGWGGRPVRVEQAQGILVAALGVLSRYYGYARDPSSPAQTTEITDSPVKIV